MKKIVEYQDGTRDYTVGDVVYRHFIQRQIRPEILPHAARDAAVELAHAVGSGRGAQQ